MKFSIIIPYYNKPNEIVKLLDSISHQNYKDFEVVLVNDGSDDINDLICAKNYEFSLKYLYFERTENSGRAFARNRGIENASGDILIFLDCDQVIGQDFISHHLLCFNNEPDSDILQFGTRRFLLDDIEVEKYDYDEIPFVKDIRHSIFSYYSYDIENIRGLWHLVYSHNMSIRKSTVERFGGFYEAFKGWGLEDTEFAYRMKKNQVHILYTSGIETYSQYEDGIIDENKRYDEWSKNLNTFINKYYEAPVFLQDIFANYFDVNRRKALFKSGIDNIWLFCFYNFENYLRQLDA